MQQHDISFEELPFQAQKELQDLEGYLRSPLYQQQIWERALTPAEREQLGRDFRSYFDQHGPKLIEACVQLRNTTPLPAMVELGYQVGHLPESRRDWLLRELGEASPQSSNLTPHWDREKSVLKLGDETIREIKRPKTAKNIVAILDAFQEEGWPYKVDDPLPGGPNGVRLARAIRSLNDNLRQIKFHGDGSGEGISWDVDGAE
jgi:hypothetical protein